MPGRQERGVYEMLVICEDCGKKFNIDPSHIKKEKAKFTCNECGHIVLVTKPETTNAAPDNNMMSYEGGMESPEMQQEIEVATPTAARRETAAKRGKGLPIGVYIFFPLLAGFLSVVAFFGYLYFTYIPDIVNNQIELRTAAIAESFSGGIQEPILLRNYLQVNKEAKRTSKLPGVAYAAVINEKGVVIAGSFSDLDRFEKQFAMRVKEKGVPVDVFTRNKLRSGQTQGSARITVGGQTIHDKVIAIQENGGEVHVGIYVTEIDAAIRKVLISPMTFSILGALLVVGFIIFILLNRVITMPMKELTNVANRISLGEMDLVVKCRGPREMRNLAVAFERMRYSIKGAMARLSK